VQIWRRVLRSDRNKVEIELRLDVWFDGLFQAWDRSQIERFRRVGEWRFKLSVWIEQIQIENN